MADSELKGNLRVVRRNDGSGGELIVESSLSVDGVAFSGKLDVAAVAPLFDASTGYAVGDVVAYDGRFWRRVAETAEPGAFVEEDWERKTLIELIKEA